VRVVVKAEQVAAHVWHVALRVSPGGERLLHLTHALGSHERLLEEVQTRRPYQRDESALLQRAEYVRAQRLFDAHVGDFAFDE
jgi:hypothetical protein